MGSMSEAMFWRVYALPYMCAEIAAENLFSHVGVSMDIPRKNFWW